jgi:long-chain acyl-CoA synthetase
MPVEAGGELDAPHAAGATLMNRCSELFASLNEWRALPCVLGDDFSYTYADLLYASDLWLSRLDELGIEAGDVVAIRTDYSLAAIAALLALLKRNAIAALIPRDANVADYLGDTHARGLLRFDSEGGYQWHGCAAPPPCHPLLEQLRARHEAGVVIFTSGSTGRPKAALHSMERFLRKVRKGRGRYRTLAFWLFDHVAGMDTLFLTLTAGGSLVLARQRDPVTVLGAIVRHKVELLATSPSFLRLMCAGPAQHYDLSSLRVIVYGSELMDPTTLAWTNARFPHARVLQKYGTTETGAPTEVSRGNDSLWFKITGAETKVVDEVLWIRSEGSILGYLNAPSPLDVQGWYCTGDLVDVDGEWIKVRGRVVATINVGGEKVMPAEVEAVILELPFVRNVVVRGEPHELMTEVVTARVALATELDFKQAAARIRAHCRGRLAPHKVPIRITTATGPLTNSRQKIDRRRLAL